MSEFMTVCEEAVRRGGAVLAEMLGKAKVRKKGPADLVTEADFASQKAILDLVLRAYPDHGFVGEEDQPGEEVNPEAEYCWFADPLDGTTNFVHGVPHFCVSLALAHRGRLLVGAVFNPMTGECYTAEAGRGAFLNADSIHTSSVDQLSESLAAVGLPSVVGPQSPDLVLFNAALDQCQALRRTGSAALNLCYVASGRFDLAWNYSTKIWDVAAGALMVQEAGGAISLPSGGAFTVDQGQLFSAANEPLMQQLGQMAAAAGV